MRTSRLAVCSFAAAVGRVLASCGGVDVILDEELASATERLRPKLSEIEMDDSIESCLEAQGVVVFVRQPAGMGSPASR